MSSRAKSRDPYCRDSAAAPRCITPASNAPKEFLMKLCIGVARVATPSPLFGTGPALLVSSELPQLLSTYKQLHQHPELSEQEKQTSAFRGRGSAQGRITPSPKTSASMTTAAGLRRCRGHEERQRPHGSRAHRHGCASRRGEDRCFRTRAMLAPRIRPVTTSA